MAPVWIVLSLLFLVLWKKIGMKRQNHNHLPPGPPKLPIIGNLHQLGQLPHQSMYKLSKRYGPVMLLHLGSMPTLVVSSAEAAREILKTHDIDSCSRIPLASWRRLTYNFLSISFAPYGDYWRQIRKLSVLQLFSATKVQASQLIREEEVARLVDSISQAASSASPVDLSRGFLSLTANIVCRMSFGESFFGSELEYAKLVDMVHEAMAVLVGFSASDYFSYVGRVLDRVTGVTERLERCYHEFDALYQRVIDHHLDPDRVKKEEDILDMLLRLQNEATGYGSSRLHLTQDHIKAILMDVFLGGMDTSATTMTWVMTELVRNKRVMKKAHDEIRENVGNKGRVDESDLAQLRYLKMVVKEAFRLHPPVVLLIPRMTMSHFKINGYKIDPKTRVHVNVWALGRDPSLWENPLEFLPERFENSQTDFKGQHFELLPFGAGRRGCPAISLGTAMVELALANVLYAFDWTLPEHGMKEEDIDMQELPGIVVGKKVPLKLVPISSTT